MASVLKGDGAGGGRETLFFAYQRLSRGVRDRRWKLIEWTVRGTRTVQLFDLQNDPDELKDLAGDPAHEGHRRRLEDLLARYKKELGDPTAKDVK